MLHALVTFAAEEGGSQAAFYISGGLLAAWAVLISFLGMTRHDDFPNESAGKAIVAITAVLVVLAATTSITTA